MLAPESSDIQHRELLWSCLSNLSNGKCDARGAYSLKQQGKL